LITSAIEAVRHPANPFAKPGSQSGLVQIGGGQFFAVTARRQLISNKANPIKGRFSAGTLMALILALRAKLCKLFFAASERARMR